jgi:predicted nucleic acid-binding protein
MTPRVYLETSVISYLTSRPSRDLVVAGHQLTTRKWWEQRRGEFALFVSGLVRREIARGDPVEARKRLDVISGIEIVTVLPEALSLAEALTVRGPLPRDGTEDALHIALAAVHGIDYLLTWNCKHIANAEMRTRIEQACWDAGYSPPILCTPEALTEV